MDGLDWGPGLGIFHQHPGGATGWAETHFLGSPDTRLWASSPSGGQLGAQSRLQHLRARDGASGPSGLPVGTVGRGPQTAEGMFGVMDVFTAWIVLMVSRVDSCIKTDRI